jgi:hypothetical protein
MLCAVEGGAVQLPDRGSQASRQIGACLLLVPGVATVGALGPRVTAVSLCELGMPGAVVCHKAVDAMYLGSGRHEQSFVKDAEQHRGHSCSSGNICIAADLTS